jgi:hypothetical protein
MPSVPFTDAQAGAAWRLRANWSYSVTWHCAQFLAVSALAMVNPRWSMLACPSTALWQSRQLTPFAACWLVSNWSTIADVSRRWHSAHLPVAEMRVEEGWLRSTAGRFW